MSRSTIYRLDIEPNDNDSFGGGSGGYLGAHRNSSLDAFGRLRVSNPITLHASKFDYPDDGVTWAEKLVGAGAKSYLSAESAYELSVGTTNGDMIVRQTRNHFPYQPGKSHFPLLTGVLGPVKTGVRSAIGYFNNNDGLFFERNENGIHVCLRTSTSGSPVDTKIPQADWNIDKLDGTGPSGIVLDASMAQIFAVDMQWLGEGSVAFAVDINGNLIYVHEMNHANMLDKVYMATATLPLRYEIENIADTASPSTMKQICSTVISEGGYDVGGYPRFAASGQGVSVGTGSFIPLITIRPKTTFGGKINRVLIKDIIYDILSENKAAEIRVIFGGTLTGASFLPVPGTSALEFDISATALTGGQIIGGTLSAAGAGQRGSDAGGEIGEVLGMPLGLDVDGANPTSITILAQAVGATSNVTAYFKWKEVF